MRALLASTVLLTVCAATALAAGTHLRHHPVEMPPKPMKIPFKLPAEAESRLLQAASGQAPATVLLHESVFQKIVSTILPVIIADAQNVTIPGESQKHFSFDTIRLSEFNIDSFTIGFSAPNNVVISLQGLSLQVPKTNFAIFDKILFVKLKCDGTFDVQMANTNIDVTFPLVMQDGKLAFGDGTATITFGTLNVNHDFPNFFCKIGQDIVQLFVGNIDNLIRSLVEKDISPVATKAINAAFQKLSAKLDFPILTAPVATSDSISITIDLLNLPKAQRHRMLTHGKRRVAHRKMGSPFPTRDVEVFVSAASFDAVFGNAQQEGKLNIHHKILKVNTTVFRHVWPAVYDACPNCPIVFSATWEVPPTAVFNNGCTLGFSGMTNVFGAWTPNGTALDLFAINLNGTFAAVNFSVTGANQNVVGFKIAILELGMSLANSTVGPIAISLIQDLINFILTDFVVADFNANFAGLPFSNVGAIDLSDMEISFANSQLSTGLDISLPLS
jgi:hypothetical protein